MISILYTDWNRIHNKFWTALRWLMQTWFVKEKSVHWGSKINLKLAFSALQVLQTLMFSSIDYIFLLLVKSPNSASFLSLVIPWFFDATLWSRFTSTCTCAISLKLHGLKLGQIQPAVPQCFLSWFLIELSSNRCVSLHSLTRSNLLSLLSIMMHLSRGSWLNLSAYPFLQWWWVFTDFSHGGLNIYSLYGWNYGLVLWKLKVVY